MSTSWVRHWEGLGDLTLVEVERGRDEGEATTSGPRLLSDTAALLFAEGYVRNGSFVARHYLVDIFQDEDLQHAGVVN
jgi:hypothetical protein